MGKSRKKDIIIFLCAFVFTILLIVYALILFITSFVPGEEKILNYTDNSSINYKVKLKANDFYSDEYIGEDYNLVASSIDKILIDFKYLLKTSDFVEGESYYTINSKIIAYQTNDSNKKKIWDYEKLIKDKTKVVYDSKIVEVNHSDSFEIDYQTYKNLMEDYKNNYLVSLAGNLVIEINIKTDLKYNNFKKDINLETRTISLNIPLTDQIVNITKTEPKTEPMSIIEKSDSKIKYLRLALSLFAFIGGILLCVFLGTTITKILGYDSKYVRKLNKILRTYNSIIVNIKDNNISKNQKIIAVETFEELLNAQNELRVPIFYTNIRKDKEDWFYLKYDEDTLIYKMKSDLYEKKA